MPTKRIWKKDNFPKLSMVLFCFMSEIQFRILTCTSRSRSCCVWNLKLETTDCCIQKEWINIKKSKPEDSVEFQQSPWMDIRRCICINIRLHAFKFCRVDFFKKIGSWLNFIFMRTHFWLNNSTDKRRTKSLCARSTCLWGPCLALSRKYKLENFRSPLSQSS
jgi:hypothetical protein